MLLVLFANVGSGRYRTNSTEVAVQHKNLSSTSVCRRIPAFWGPTQALFSVQDDFVVMDNVQVGGNATRD